MNICPRCKRDLSDSVTLLGPDVLLFHAHLHERDDYYALTENKNTVLDALRHSLDVLKRVRDFEDSNEESRKSFWEDGFRAIEKLEKALHLLGVKKE